MFVKAECVEGIRHYSHGGSGNILNGCGKCRVHYDSLRTHGTQASGTKWNVVLLCA